MASSFFKPKQHITLSATDLAELQGDGSPQAIKASLSFAPPFEVTSIVHDNACGAGAVTELILTADPAPPSGIRIHATDIDANFVAGTKTMTEERGWPVETGIMDARKLRFGDNFFTHSFTAFAFHCMPCGEDAAKEIHRTLQPGGTAIAMIWSSMPHVAAFQEAHWRTRGRDGVMPSLLLDEPPFTGKDLENLLRAGGFDNIEMHDMAVKVKIVNMEHWAQLGWSYLGRLPGTKEWNEEDEERWDEAIETIIDEMQKHGRSEKGDNGEVFLKFTACVAVAEK
jgi:SAM-dependent methyltransferase